jgi:cell pole-organizing protein PopZ
MNKPAAKEPSMDEILSSIRQIIADDDAAGVPRRPAIQAAPPPMQAAPAVAAPGPLDRDLSDMLDDIEPLALSTTQIVDDEEGEGLSFDDILADTENHVAPPVAAAAAPLVEPDDVTFAAEEPVPELPSFNPPPSARVPFTPEPEPVRAAPEPEPARAAPEPEPFRPRPPLAQAAPLPDPTLTAEMAEELLEPATKAAVRNSITRLTGLGIGNPGATIESLMRDMLRPMLKEWLDENLPSVVERMVEKEIARISRGD